MADTLKDIFCPACGKKMKKIVIDEHKICVDVCADGCGGVWFDNREYENFDEQYEDISDILNELKGKTFVKVDSKGTRQCPVCKVNLVKNFSSFNKKVELDECYSCGGKFLDYGEIETIRAEYATDEDRTRDFLKFANGIFGKDFDEAEQACQKMLAERSEFKKFYDEYICDKLVKYF